MPSLQPWLRTRDRATSQLGTTHLATPTPPNETPAERISQYQQQGDDRHTALEQKRCAVHDLLNPPSCRPPLNRELAAGVSRLATVVEPDSSPPRSDIDPHFYLRQIFDRSNTKKTRTVRLSVGNHTIYSFDHSHAPRRVQGGGARLQYCKFLCGVGERFSHKDATSAPHVCCVKEGGGGEMPLATKMLCREYGLE